MKYADWETRLEELENEHAKLREASGAAFQLILEHKSLLMLQVTLTSGLRATLSISERHSDRALQITMADGRGFRTFAEISIADSEDLLEIRRALEAWQRGELDELPRPDRPFGCWPGRSAR